VIHVIATVELQPAMRERFLQEFAKVVPDVQRESGCIEYGGAVDVASGIPVQGPLRDNVVMVVEKWASLDALKAHLTAPHMLAYRAKVKELVVGTTLLVLEPAG
jgi:quinol monooxygenase YgiN